MVVGHDTVVVIVVHYLYLSEIVYVVAAHGLTVGSEEADRCLVVQECDLLFDAVEDVHLKQEVPTLD
jgi:hypothetical protein